MRIKSGIASTFALLCALCVFSLAACGTAPVVGNQPASGQSPTAQSGSGSPTGNGNNGTPTKTTQPVPPTTTDCPASGKARAAITAPLAPGSDATIVYAVNSPYGTKSPTAILKRYNTRTAQKTVILTLENTNILSEQLSVDGQWILFIAAKSGSPDRLEMIRLDGQGQQTLTCGSISLAQWSPDQKYIAFDQTTSSAQDIDLLTLADGTLQTELHNAKTSISDSVHVKTWLDNTHLYLFGISIDGHHNAIFLLDVNKGADQSIKNIPALTQNQFLDFDSSFDGQQLYIATSDCETIGCLPPGLVTIQSSTSADTGKPLLNDPKHAIMTIRAVTDNTLLFVLNNSAKPSLDNTQNGLWKMKPDGTGLTRLTNDTNYANTHLNEQSQYSWSNLSRDNSSFTIEEDTQGGSTGIKKSALAYGSLSGGSLQTFAQGDDTQALDIVGWTVM